MDKPTRAELLARAKERALVYVDAGRLSQALVSMLSDMDHLPDATREGNDAKAAGAVAHVIAGDVQGMRNWIEGVQ